MPFDPKTAKPVTEKSGFDLSTARTVKSNDDEISKLETFIRNASQSATFNFGDEAQALIRGLSPVQLEPSSVKIPGTDMPVPTLGWNADFGKFKELLDTERKRTEAATEANPKTALAGSVAGAVPQGLAVARSMAAAPGLLPRVLNAAETSARLAAPSVVGAIDTSDPEWAKKAAEDAALQTIIGAAAPVAEKVINPAVKYAAGKAFPQAVSGTVDDTAEVLKKGRPQPGRTIGDVISENTSLPVAGALAGIGAREFGPQEISGDKIPWSPDPMSAAIDRALYGGAGALAGLGLRTAKNVAGDALVTGGRLADTAGKKMFETGERMITEAPRGRFSKLDEWLHGIEKPKGPGPVPPPVSPNAPNLDKRKAAMAQQSTVQGRANTNTDTPQDKVRASEVDLDEWMKKVRGNK